MTTEDALIEIMEERALIVKAGAPFGNRNAAKDHTLQDGTTVRYKVEHGGTIRNSRNDISNPGFYEDKESGHVQTSVDYAHSDGSSHSQVVSHPFSSGKERDEIISRQNKAFEDSKSEVHKDWRSFGKSLSQKAGVMWSVKASSASILADLVKAGAPFGNRNASKGYSTEHAQGQADASTDEHGSKAAYLASVKAIKSGSQEDHAAARNAHIGAAHSLNAASRGNILSPLNDKRNDHLSYAQFHRGKTGYMTGSSEEVLKDLVKAGAPVGNTNAAKDHMSSEEQSSRNAEAMKEHDSIRHNAQIHDPKQFMAHTASISAHETSDKTLDGRATHEEAAAAHGVAEKLHRELGNSEYADKHAAMVSFHNNRINR
jgi:hypothetical protein